MSADTVARDALDAIKARDAEIARLKAEVNRLGLKCAEQANTIEQLRASYALACSVVDELDERLAEH